MASFKTLFFPPKNKSLAQKISIASPEDFRRSVSTLKQGGLSTQEFRALNLAKTRAKVQLLRKNLRLAERKEMNEIARTKIK